MGARVCRPGVWLRQAREDELLGRSAALSGLVPTVATGPAAGAARRPSSGVAGLTAGAPGAVLFLGQVRQERALFGLLGVSNHIARFAEPGAARRDLGFEAQVGLEDGLRDLVAWWRPLRSEIAAGRSVAPAGAQQGVPA